MIYCYYYDETTKEYIDCDTAPLNPVASKKEGKEVYSLPYCSTFTKPPKINKFKAAIYEEETDSWRIVDDFRNEYIVNADMNIRTMKDLGSLPVGYIHITAKQAEAIEADPILYIIKDKKLVKNPNYEEVKNEKEKELVKTLAMSKYDFFKYICQPNNVSYATLMEKVNSDDDIAALWNLCGHVHRNDEVFIEFMRKSLFDISDDALNEAFKTYGKTIID